MKDMHGYDIVEGSRVVYAARRGSSCWLNECDVVRVDEVKGLVLKNIVGGKPYYFRASTNIRKV